MKEFTITDNDAGQRLDRYVSKAVPMLPASLAQKYIRIKRIKVSGKAMRRDYRLNSGDIVQMYINDEFFSSTGDSKAYLHLTNSVIDIIYEDENIILLNKPAGMLCHNAEGNYTDTLISRVQAYLFKNGFWHPDDSNSFTPALCNRIDRNTSGMVIAAKNAAALRIMCDKLRSNEIDKYYLAIVHGIPKPPVATLKSYIFKDSVKNRVYVKNEKIPGAKEALMEYKTLETINHRAGNLSVLECRLITGRTHQIRAQLASIGHPIIGDSKYGRGDLDRPFGKCRKDERCFDISKQALCSYKIVFSFKNDAGILTYLNNQTFTLR